MRPNTNNALIAHPIVVPPANHGFESPLYDCKFVMAYDISYNADEIGDFYFHNGDKQH